MVRSLEVERRIARTSDIGLRRLAPPADADGHAVAQLGDDLVLGHALVAIGARRLVAVRSRLLHERVAVLVGHAGQVQLEREALLEAVAALHVPRVDAVERLLGRPDDGRALRRDLAGDLAGRRPRSSRWGTTCSTEPKWCSSAAVAVADV